MRFRFRVGPFTFGKSGTRLSLWKGGTGVSVPLSKKNKGSTFVKVKAGPVMGLGRLAWSDPRKPLNARDNETKQIPKKSLNTALRRKRGAGFFVRILAAAKTLLFNVQNNTLSCHSAVYFRVYSIDSGCYAGPTRL